MTATDHTDDTTDEQIIHPELVVGHRLRSVSKFDTFSVRVRVVVVVIVEW